MLNPDQLVVSKWHCAKCDHFPIDYIEASAYATDLEPESFDLVHMRLLLCHLTEPAKVLREVYRLLKPGGTFVCGDLKLSSLFCYPESEIFSRSVEYGLATGKALGVNYDYGVRLPADVMAAGFRAVDVRLDHPAYLRGPEKRLWEHTFAEAVPVVVRCGVAPEYELTSMLTGMRRLAEDERVLIAQWCLAGVIAIK